MEFETMGAYVRPRSARVRCLYRCQCIATASRVCAAARGGKWQPGITAKQGREADHERISWRKVGWPSVQWPGPGSNSVSWGGSLTPMAVLWLWDRAPELRRWRSVRAKYGCTSEFADVDSDVCVCSMFGGSKLAQNTTMLWGSHKKKAIKSNPWVSFS